MSRRSCFCFQFSKTFFLLKNYYFLFSQKYDEKNKIPSIEKNLRNFLRKTFFGVTLTKEYEGNWLASLGVEATVD